MLSLRISATLIAVSALSYVFLRMVLSQQEKILRNEQLRRDGMANVSHELRTPLATAITRVDAMLDGIRPTDPAQLRSLSGSLNHLRKIVDDLYQLALADVDALVINKDWARLDLIVKSALEAVQDKFKEKRFHVVMNSAKAINIYGDAMRLRQIIDNLLENCYRYTNEAATIEISLREGKGVIKLTISDSGPGVDDQTLPVLFDRFIRGDVSRNRETGGSGLGLSLVKAMVSAHDGKVSAFRSDRGGLGIAMQFPAVHS